ncbi:MAG: superoxide dismutase [Acidimicrobiales bacterium]
MAIELPPLPFAEDALAPHMSAETLSFHYGKHHAGYVNKLNAAIEGTPDADKSLEDIVTSASGGVFNNAAQIWNHTFFWNSMSPDGGGDPSGALKDAIEASFGSVDEFKTKFASAAGTLFGSGWTWLVSGDSGLEIVQTKDADTPLAHGKTALLTIDVWEHAYYLDFQNARPAYIETWLENLVNWEHAAANLG